MKKLSALLSVAALLSITGCASKQQPLTESILWEVSGNGLTESSYLLGTHHFANRDVLDKYPSYKEAIEKSVQVVGELEMEQAVGEAQAIMMEYSMLPEGVDYHSFLSAEQYNALDELLIDNFGAGLAQYGRFKPAMINNMYAAMMYMKTDSGFNPLSHEAIDAYVQRLATAGGKKVIGLETTAEQMELLMNSEPLEVQAEALLCSLSSGDEGVDMLVELNRLYANGELEAMYDLAFNNPDDQCPMSEEFGLAINKKRNDNWLSKLPAIMSGGPSLVAVGALHLAGEPGLVNQLRELGYTLTPLR